MQILKQLKPLKIIPVTIGLIFLVGLNAILVMPTLHSILMPTHETLYQIVAFHPMVLMALIMIWTIRRVHRSSKNA